MRRSPAEPRPVPRPLALFVSLAALTVLAVVCLPWMPPAVSAQDAPTTGFIDTVDVNVVNIDVVVTDRKGRPVSGLDADAFELLEDGEPMDIRYFTEVSGGAPSGGSGAAVPRIETDTRVELQAIETEAVETETVDPEPTLDDTRYVVFLFDQQSLQTNNRKRFLAAIDEFVVNDLGDGDQVMVAVASRGLSVVQGFTDDASQVKTAIGRVAELAEGGTMREVAQRNLVLDLAQTSFGSSTTEAIDPSRVEMLSRVFGAQIEGEARTLYLQTLDSLGAMAVMVDSLAGIQGRKALVHVSEGMPMRPGESLFTAFSNKFNRYSDDTMAQAPQIEALAYDLSKEFISVLELAQDSDVAVYAVDAAGRRADLRASAAYGTADIATQDNAGGADVWNSSIQLQDERNRREGPELIAKGSGGAMLINSRKYGDFLSRVGSDLGNYYSLGYQPQRARSGELHEIEVRLRESAMPRGVDADKLQLQYRRSYRNRTWPQVLEDLARAELRVGGGRNDMGLELQVGDLEARPGGDSYIAPLAIIVAAESLTLIPVEGGSQGQLEAVLVIQDEDGNLSPPNPIPVTAQIQGDTELEPGTRLLVGALSIALEAGPKQIAVALRDGVSGRSAVAQASITPSGSLSTSDAPAAAAAAAGSGL